jgi:two-component system, LytTR family, sensor kinase
MPKSPLSTPKFIIIFSIAWWAIMQDQAMVLHWFGWNIQVAIIDSVTSNTILLLACLLVFNVFRYYLPEKDKYFLLIAWCVALTIAVTLLSRWVLNLLLGSHAGYSAQLDLSLIIRISFIFLILGCIILISVVWYGNINEKENEKRKQDAERLTKEAELYKLRQQLQPHFLFNSLNSINALIGSEPKQARKMIQQLSDFLRGTLKKEEHQWVSLKEEIQYLQLYLDIEKVRFANRLTTIINCDDSVQELKLPALLLQPIVENAIKFGLYDTTEETVIHLNANKDDKNLLIEVQNPFDPETSTPQKGTGFGLSSIQRRLFLLFARTDLLTTEINNKTFITRVKIPQHE